MLTEEDTFKALSRTPYRQVSKAMWNQAMTSRKAFSSEEEIQFLADNGWTKEEYHKAMQVHYGLSDKDE